MVFSANLKHINIEILKIEEIRSTVTLCFLEKLLKTEKVIIMILVPRTNTRGQGEYPQASEKTIKTIKS